MKEFRKTEDGLFICEECNVTFDTRQGIGNHIGRKHNKKEYFDKWIKEEYEGLCKVCKKEVEFRDLFWGYKNCCKKCIKLYNQLRTEEEIFKIYGVKNVFQVKEIKDKCKQHHLQTLGFEYPSQSPKIKKQKEETCFKNNGVKYPMQSKIIREKSKLSCLKTYGVEFNMQNKEIFEKNQKSGFKTKKFQDTNINYRGTFELDFLEKYFDKYSDIQNGPTIKYIFQEKIKIYFPDFYIPSLNLVVECKNSYLARIDKDKIKAKEKATIANGFNYILIIDKDYSKLK
jgi:hypothetical protein